MCANNGTGERMRRRLQLHPPLLRHALAHGAEVGHFRVALRIEQHVGRLEVAAKRGNKGRQKCVREDYTRATS